MKTALITGITGQDSFHLTELLLGKEYKIYGLLNGIKTSRVIDFSKKFPNVVFIEGNLTDSASLIKSIEISKPDEIYTVVDKKNKEINYDEKPENMDGVERKVERSKEQFFRIVRPLEHLLQSAILYVASRELARGAVLNVKSQEKIPKIYELPGLVRAALEKLKIKDSTLRNENNSVSLEDRLYFIQNMYTNNPAEPLSKAKARLIDRQANSIATGKEDSAPVTLEEFEAVVDHSFIFKSPKDFKDNIQTVFTDTPIGMLKQILPVTGLFIVDEKGWTYAGYNNFNKLVKIASITQGKYKLIPKNAIEKDIAAAEEIPELAV